MSAHKHTLQRVRVSSINNNPPCNSLTARRGRKHSTQLSTRRAQRADEAAATSACTTGSQSLSEHRSMPLLRARSLWRSILPILAGPAFCLLTVEAFRGDGRGPEGKNRGEQGGGAWRSSPRRRSVNPTRQASQQKRPRARPTTAPRAVLWPTPRFAPRSPYEHAMLADDAIRPSICQMRRTPARTYLLPQATLKCSPTLERENPRQPTWTPMRLFLRRHLVEHANRRWGDEAGLEAESEAPRRGEGEKG